MARHYSITRSEWVTFTQEQDDRLALVGKAWVDACEAAKAGHASRAVFDALTTPLWHAYLTTYSRIMQEVEATR